MEQRKAEFIPSTFATATYMEEPARRAFEAGRVTFLRNWPYVYATANRATTT